MATRCSLISRTPSVLRCDGPMIAERLYGGRQCRSFQAVDRVPATRSLPAAGDCFAQRSKAIRAGLGATQVSDRSTASAGADAVSGCRQCLAVAASLIFANA